jgi:hypothetical protein
VILPHDASPKPDEIFGKDRTKTKRLRPEILRTTILALTRRFFGRSSSKPWDALELPKRSMRSCGIICHIAAIDSNRRCYAALRLVIVRLARHELAWINVTAHPTGESIAQQKTETFPSNEAPRYEFAIGTGSTALWPRANYEPWASGPLPTPKYALELPASTNKTIRAYMKKFNNTLEGTDCGDAGLPANGYEMPKPKTTLRVVPKTPETSVRDHLSGPEANSTIASHSERGSRLPEPR